MRITKRTEAAFLKSEAEEKLAIALKAGEAASAVVQHVEQIEIFTNSCRNFLRRR